MAIMQNIKDILTKITRGELPYYKNISNIDIATHFNHTIFEPEKTLQYAMGYTEDDSLFRINDESNDNPIVKLTKLFIENNNIKGLMAIEEMFDYISCDSGHFYKVYHAAQHGNLETFKYVIYCFAYRWNEVPILEIDIDVLIELSNENINKTVSEWLKLFKRAVIMVNKSYDNFDESIALSSKMDTSAARIALTFCSKKKYYNNTISVHIIN